MLSPVVIALVAKASVLPSSSVMVIVFVPLVMMPSLTLLNRSCSVLFVSWRSSLIRRRARLALVWPLVKVSVPLVA